jgi:CelD/BcsL family acetyltransferase involved in cellulose biosynthesis
MGLERCNLAGFERIAAEWEGLAERGGSPFLTAAWLASWWGALGAERELALVLRGEDGAMLAGSCFIGRRRTLRAAANAHTNDWGIVARDAAAGLRFWEELAALSHNTVALEPLQVEDGAAPALREVLRAAGYRVVEEELNPSPWLELPSSLDSLLAGRSRNLRSQVGRRRRTLQREGVLSLRVVRGGSPLERDLEAFFALEASGWKGRRGTAIASDPALVALYRSFAERAARDGRLRLYMLELDGRLVAADYGCVFDGCGFLIKTAFDEDLGRLAPGLVLRAEVLRASIEEGLSRYDFLGGPDSYKMRWADRLRGRTSMLAFRGSGTAPVYVWRRWMRPSLKAARGEVTRRMEDLSGWMRRRRS